MAVAQNENILCPTQETACLSSLIENEIPDIEEASWRDYAYRDLAVSTAYEGDIDKAVAYIAKIESGDTQAMTIRAIGMALALHKDMENVYYKRIFTRLNTAAKQIKDEGARDIAYTYIAMAQAFAGLDEDATLTTAAMQKPELKYKAFAETAEIQAERGDFRAAMTSIEMIQSVAFKNKALSLISAIFTKRGDYESAYQAAMQITNSTKKANALQNIVNVKIGLDEQQGGKSE